MVTLLANYFIKENGEPADTRQSYGMLCGIVGILLNVLLFVGKFAAGSISKSIAITADAFNNLSDAGSSFVTLIGFKLAGAKPDTSHPFGHGRIEYLSGLIVSAAILIMGVELIQTSIGKILHPEATEFSALSMGILVAAILVKFYMFYYNSRVAKKIDSAAMKATAMDSLSDMGATGMVLVAALIGHFTGLKIDGYCGVLVGALVFYAGIQAARETLNPLLGQAPDPELVQKIEDIVMSHESICGMHDLIVHDYGPGRQMVSLHAEVPAEGNILEIHDEIDLVEMELHEKLHCMATIHMDPIVTKDEKTAEAKAAVEKIVSEMDAGMTIHDFRMVIGPTHTNLIFDMVVPFENKMTHEELRGQLQSQVKQVLGSQYFTVVQLDQPFV